MNARETYEYWVSHRICGPRFWDTARNAKLLNDWIDSNREGIVTLDTLREAEYELRNHLVWKPDSMSAEEISAKAAAERQEKATAAQLQVLQTWLAQHCPKGLLCANGEPFPGDQDKIVAFIVTNYRGQFSNEALNDAVTVLAPVLTWMSSDPVDREIRNQPAPPPRKLSEQAMIDAGLKRPAAPLKSHTKTDGQFNDPTSKLKYLTKKVLGENNPWKERAESLVVQGRTGKIDAIKTAELRKVIYRRGTEIDWERTYHERNKLADAIDRVKNRD